MKQDFKGLAFRHGWAQARVAIARKLAIRLYIILRDRSIMRSMFDVVRLPECPK